MTKQQPKLARPEQTRSLGTSSLGTLQSACPKFADRLVDLSDGELPPDERAIVEAHVADCPGCRAELRRLNASLAAITSTLTLVSREEACSRSVVSVDATAPGPGLVPAEGRRGRTGRRRAPLIAAPVTLAALVLVAIGLWYFPPPADSPNIARKEPAHKAAAQPDTPSIALAAPEPLDEAAALRQIALIEQQARLETWLELMPTGREYDDQRAANEALLVRFRDASDDVPANRSSRPLEETL